jgi:hypothetical protein
MRSAFSTTRQALAVTRSRLDLLSADMATTAVQLPKGYYNEHTKRYIAVNLTVFIGDYDQVIVELTAQRNSLQAIANSLASARGGIGGVIE